MAITSKEFSNIVTKSKVRVDVNLSKDLEGLNKSQKTALKKLVGETLISEVKNSTAKRTSPVNQKGSNAFAKLTKEYRKKKMKAGKGGQPNLRLKEEMINDLFSKNKADGVSLRITNSLSKKKAENHNHGVTLPRRQFLPTKNGQGFKREVMTVVNAAIKNFKKNIDS